MKKVALFLWLSAGALHADVHPPVGAKVEAALTELFKSTDSEITDHAVIIGTLYDRAMRDASLTPEARDARLAELEARALAAARPRSDTDLELVPSSRVPPLVDGGEQDSLLESLEWARSAAARGPATAPFGRRRVRRADLVATIDRLVEVLTDGGEIAKHFDVYRSPGLSATGEVLFTAYHDPVYRGALTKDGTYRWPLYASPASAGIAVSKFSRAEIAGGALAGRDLELAWMADPMDAYLLEIQGSGIVRLKEGGFLKVDFAAKNGRPYRSLGKAMVRAGVLTPWEVNIPVIRKWLAEHPERLREFLDLNTSAVFFSSKRLATLPEKTAYHAGRSVACDQSWFAKGGVGFVALTRPVFGPSVRWVPHQRFIVNHDTGGAIRGPGHIDLYWGHDDEAEQVAGALREPGTLYYLLRKGTPLIQK